VAEAVNEKRWFLRKKWRGKNKNIRKAFWETPANNAQRRHIKNKAKSSEIHRQLHHTFLLPLYPPFSRSPPLPPSNPFPLLCLSLGRALYISLSLYLHSILFYCMPCLVFHHLHIFFQQHLYGQFYYIFQSLVYYFLKIVLSIQFML
jgi:hypothetical protein